MQEQRKMLKISSTWSIEYNEWEVFDRFIFQEYLSNFMINHREKKKHKITIV